MYKENFMPSGGIGYCSVSAVMGVLNRFWGTNFNVKDTFDVVKLAKFGKFNLGELLNIDEIAYFLNKVDFDATFNTGFEEKDVLEYLNDPVGTYKKNIPEEFQKYIKGNYFMLSENTRLDISDTKCTKYLYDNGKIKFNEGIEKIIKENQADNVLFLLGLNSFSLYGHESSKQESSSGGHVLLTIGFDNDKFIIYDEDDEVKPKLIDKEKVFKAMEYKGRYEFLTIKYDG